MKLATIYTPGSYGTFISWCVYSFSELNPSDAVVSPIDTNGSGHKFWGTEGNRVITTTHDWLDKKYDGYIIIDCDRDKIINYIDNQFQKFYLNDFDKYLSEVFPGYTNKLKESWGGDARWEVRELLSFFLGDMISDTKNQIDVHQSRAEICNFYRVSPEKFLINPATELEKLLEFFNLKKNNNFNNLKSHVTNYLSLQNNFIKNDQLNNFIDSTINNVPYSISEASMFDEAYIQNKLRLLGYNIKCYNLNEFPNNSAALYTLLE